MRNRSGYMINPLTGRQVKMNGKVAKNVYRMIGGASTEYENNTDLSSQLSEAQNQLSQQTQAMEESLNQQKAELSAAEQAMQAAQKAEEEASKKEQEAQSAIETATAEKDSALERETQIKEDLTQLGNLMGNLSESLDKTSKKSLETDTSPFCTFDRLEKSLNAEEKEKLRSEEAKKLFDEMTTFISSVSTVVSTTVNYLGLFSSENRGRRTVVNDNVNSAMLGGARKRKQRRSGNKRR